MTKLGSTSIAIPKPLHFSQAPIGLLKVKKCSLGSVNFMLSNSNSLENVNFFCDSYVYITHFPFPSMKARLIESLYLLILLCLSKFIAILSIIK